MSANGLSQKVSAVSPTRRSFYRRPLPDICTALSSDEGRALFASALANDGLKSFFPLVEQFTTQAEPAYCGPSTLVVILNALSVDPRRTWKGPWRWYEESMLNCCVDLEYVKKAGITFDTFACLAKCQGLVVDASLASESSVEGFRHAVKKACVSQSSSPAKEKQTFLVVSYSRKVVGQTGDGHFSPVAAYDEVSDSVLILDTARFKYGPHWVPLQLLFDAMLPLDKDTNRSRGFVLLSYDGEDPSSHLPQSILFRSKKVQNHVRRRYKVFLADRDSEEPISFDEVESYWTKDGEQPLYIWEMLEPQLVPVDEQEAKYIESALRLVQKLIGDVPRLGERTPPENSCCSQGCAKGAFRKIPIAVDEAIYIVYLSSLPAELRREIVFEDVGKDDLSNITREQLIREAELVHYAIDTSDLEGGETQE